MKDYMSFGDALQALKDGKQVARHGWNGKNMYLYIEDCLSFTIREGAYKGRVRKYEPCICMFTADGTHQPGWLASQKDMLADDWFEVK